MPSLPLRALLALLLLPLLAGAALSAPAAARTLDAGGDLGCAVRDDGQLLCWGAGDLLPSVDHPFGALSAIPATGVGDAVDVAVGATHGCAVRAGGTVACWGADDAGQLGDGGGAPQFVPVAASGVAHAAAVTVGDAHSCARLREGTVTCWGSDAVGQSGGYDGLGAVGVVALDAGARSTCAAIDDGTVTCWGLPLATVLSPAISDAAAVAAGDGHACALRRGGTVICWGANDRGQLGLGTSAPVANPRDVPGLSGVRAIAAGGATTCALRADGTVACWGAGSDGQLGDGLLLDRSAPVTVAGVREASEVTVGSAQACALRADGSALCWGANDAGQLGNGRASSTLTPVPVPGTGGALAVATGTGGHRCAAFGGAGARCWGANDRGQLGDGTRERRVAPTPVSGLAAADAVAVGHRHSCAIDGARVECWGAGENGRLGNGTTSDRATAVPVPGVQALRIAAGERSSCAVTTASRVACWGARWFDASPPRSAHWEDVPTPTEIAGSDLATDVVVLDNASCALFSDRTVKCWGMSDDGQLGNGWRSTTLGSTDPIAVRYADFRPLTGVLAIARADDASICALLEDESFACWGGEHYDDYARAVDVDRFPLPPGDSCLLGADGVTCVGSGCELHPAGVSCVGDGALGQLGDGYQPGGHYPLQPLAAPLLGIGGAVRQPLLARGDVTEIPPPSGRGTDGPPPSPPSSPPVVATPRATVARPFTIAGARAGRGGRIALTLTLPARGTVHVRAHARVSGRRIAWLRMAKPRPVARGRRSLALAPTRAARRALARSRSGRLTVTLRITHRPRGGRAVTRTTTVVVRR